MTRLSIDLSRIPTAKERRALEARAARLHGQFGVSAENATSAMKEYLGVPGRLASGGLRIRKSFSCLEKPLPEDEASDRRAPEREVRPPATRISSGKGTALRLYLTALAAEQVKNPPGRRATFNRPLAPFTGEWGWSDLIATPAVYSRNRGTGAAIRDKKARTLHNALDTLEEANLVQLSGAKGQRRRYEEFSILNEAGAQLTGDPVPYVVPLKNANCLALPAGFVTNGWLHVLEDSEITLLLMVACGRGTLAPVGDEPDILPGEVAIPGSVRLSHYGIHRDPFSTAHKTLEWFGLLRVRELGRHYDGRAEEASTRLHRLSLIQEGFEQSALNVARETIDRQMAR